MRKIIETKLKEIEKKENVRIIYAVESGSRAWGFASPDSDYDVRFIYVRPKDYYLRLDKTKDVIEWQLDETFDINGWDLQKALRLLHGSNPTLFEWNNSPIQYKTTEDWTMIQDEINHYFSSKSGLYHYLNTANRNYHEFLLDEMVKYKKYFYVIRPLLACKWILDKHCPPPMLFTELADTELDADIKETVNRLLELKMNTPEMEKGKRIDLLNDYIRRNLMLLKTQIDALPHEHKADWKQLNRLFLDIVNHSL